MLCEQCTKEIKEIDNVPSIWVADDSFQGEHLAFFCNDNCLVLWWESDPSFNGVLG